MDNLDFKLDALVGAISFPNYKEEKDVCTITVDNFDHLTITDTIKSNERLANFEGATVKTLVELVQLLSENKPKCNLMLVSSVTFYWNNLPILFIKYKGTESDRMMAVSVKRYQDSLNDKLQSQQIGRALGYGILGLGGLLCVGLIYAYFRSNANNTNNTSHTGSTLMQLVAKE